jgi:hypothetical protein
MQNDAAVKVVPTSMDIISFLADPLYGDLSLWSASDMVAEKTAEANCNLPFRVPSHGVTLPDRDKCIRLLI